MDGSLVIRDSDIFVQEQTASSKFKSKTITSLTVKPCNLNSFTIRKIGPTPTELSILVPSPTSINPNPDSQRNTSVNYKAVTFANKPEPPHATTQANISITTDGPLFSEPHFKLYANEDTTRPKYMANTTKPILRGPRTKKKLGIRSKIIKYIVYRIMQEEKVKRIALTDMEELFVSNRELAKYVGLNFRPDVCASVNTISPGNDLTNQQHIKQFRKITTFIKETADQGLDFVRLILETVRLVILTDASFTSAKGLKI